MRFAILTVLVTGACFNMPSAPALSGDGGPTGDGGTGSSDAPPASANIAFLSSQTFVGGELGGLAGADTVCAGLAVTAGFPGTYVAWLASSTASAASRLGSARGWVRPDGLPVADTVADLVAGKIMYPILVDDTHVDHTGTHNIGVLTGANADGTATADTCTNYTSQTTQGSGGLASETTMGWTTGTVSACSTAQYLYCFGTSRTTEVDHPAIPPDAKTAFITSGAFVVGGGLAAADTLCANDATAAGLRGTYVALIATETAAASTRLSGVYVRPDGVPLGAIPSSIITPINVTAAGNYLGVVEVWTGSSNNESPLTSAGTANTTCDNWGNGNVDGTAGETSSGLFFFDANLALVCSPSAAVHLYCVEQ